MQNSHAKVSTVTTVSGNETRFENEYYYCLKRAFITLHQVSGPVASSNPDTQYGIIVDGNRFLLYDFAHKILVDDPDYGAFEWSYAWEIDISGVFANAYKDSFLEDYDSTYKTSIKEIEDGEIAGIKCKGYEWQKNYSNYLSTGAKDIIEKRIWVDPATNVTMKTEGFRDDKLQDGTVQNVQTGTVEVTLLERDCVTQKAIEDMINALYKGHESEFKKMTMEEYQGLGY